MLSKAQIKYIRSLTQQKYRKEHNVFLAEGDKIAREWLQSEAEIRMVVATPDWLDRYARLAKSHHEAEVFEADEATLVAVSSLKTPNEVLLVAEIPAYSELPVSGRILALDTIQDPGNMGSIIRIADWFGIEHIVLSPGCVEVYNPKVVQAAMGSHLRVRFSVSDLSAFIKSLTIPVLAAALEGSPVYEQQPLNDCVLLIGNESRGIDPALIALATERITIPRIGGAESLNAAIATGILCAQLAPRYPAFPDV